MATYTDLTIYDRTPVTPVLHTFVPMGRENGSTSARWREAGTVPAGDKIITADSKRLNDGGYRLSMKMSLPVLGTQTLGGITTYPVLDQSLGVLEFRFSANSTLQQRKDQITLLLNAALETPIDDAFSKLEGWNA